MIVSYLELHRTAGRIINTPRRQLPHHMHGRSATGDNVESDTLPVCAPRKDEGEQKYCSKASQYLLDVASEEQCRGFDSGFAIVAYVLACILSVVDQCPAKKVNG